MSVLTYGRYELRERLGEGAHGEVWAGIDSRLNRPVAIKVLKTDVYAEGGGLARFQNEANNLARLLHQNITTLFSLEDDPRPFMVMELVDGHTLDDLMARKRLTITESLSIVAQTISGLSYAHSMGIIHRDLKPSNLMIDKGGTVKLMDFSIARTRGSKRLTRDGSIIGTPAYMSPEQVRGGEGDERSDLYSLAIILYEMLSGAAPFDGGTEYDLIRAQVETPPPPLQGKVRDLPPALEAALMRALSKPPEARFQTVREFGSALERAGSRPVPATLQQTLTDAGLGLAGTREISIPRRDDDDASTVEPHDRKKNGERRNFWPLLALGGSLVVLLAVGGYVFKDWGRKSSQPSPPVQTSALTPPPSPPRPAGPVAGEITGTVAHVFDSNALMVGNKIINLYGIRDPQSPDSRQPIIDATRAILSNRGNNVDCVPQGGDNVYRCRVNRDDLGKLILNAGLAMANDNAPPEYLAAQQQAETAQHGIWAPP